MASVAHVVKNFLNSAQLLVLQLDGQKVFDPSVLGPFNAR
jgi:hypothetical protein